MIEIDRKSLLVHVSWDVTLAALERALDAVGLTLGLVATSRGEDHEARPGASTVRAFLEGDALGAASPWNDPADHLVAGLRAVEKNGARKLDVKPAPRRATGPDLTALVLGQRGRYFELTDAWLRVHEKDAPRVHASFAAPNPPEITRDEEALFAKIARELAARGS